MRCPRCSNEWDASKNLCLHCGLQLRSTSSANTFARPAAMPTADTSPPTEQLSRPTMLSSAASAVPVRSIRRVPIQSINTVYTPQSPSSQASIRPPTPLQRPSEPAIATQAIALTPNTMLNGGRYRLLRRQEIQEWAPGSIETSWLAFDTVQSDSTVIIRELVTPEGSMRGLQSIPYRATMALTAISKQLPSLVLRDAFNDRERTFFVFELVEGDTLLTLLHRSSDTQSEQTVIEWCLSMAGQLEILAQQTPPMVHGLIQPEHIVKKNDSGEYVLTNFSLFLAGGAAPLLQKHGATYLSPYMAPEVSSGIIDIRSDIYSLAACAYHALTGNIPGAAGGMPLVRQLKPAVSQQLEALLIRGLSADPGQRYQHPAELRLALLALHPQNEGHLAPSRLRENGQRLQLRRQMIRKRAESLSTPSSIATIEKHPVPQQGPWLVPAPEELPPFKEGKDLRSAIFWFVGMLVCLLPLLLGRGI